MKLKKLFNYLYYEHGYWLFDWVLPIIGFILFAGVIAYLILHFVEPIPIELRIVIH